MEKDKKKLTRVDRLIRDAFADLLEEQDFMSIKVSEIIRRAGVSRSAFYAHYEDKFALINQIEQELFDGFRARMREVRRQGLEYQRKFDEEQVTGELETAYFKYIAQEYRWWKLFMTGRGKSDFVQRFTHVIYDQFSGTAEEWNEPNDRIIPLSVGLTMNAWVYVGTISFWIETGMKHTPEEMGRFLAVYWHRYKRFTLQ